MGLGTCLGQLCVHPNEYPYVYSCPSQGKPRTILGHPRAIQWLFHDHPVAITGPSLGHPRAMQRPLWVWGASKPFQNCPPPCFSPLPIIGTRLSRAWKVKIRIDLLFNVDIVGVKNIQSTLLGTCITLSFQKCYKSWITIHENMHLVECKINLSTRYFNVKNNAV